MTSAATPSTTPTPAQLRYLKTLAQRAGQTISLPTTRQHASRMIDRLRSGLDADRDSNPTVRDAEVARERNAVAADVDAGVGDAVRYRADETTGYGSSARWASRPEREQIISNDPIPRRLIPHVGPRKQLARYRTTSGAERILWGQRIDGVARVSDRPASDIVTHSDHAHLVATNLTSRTEMNAAIDRWLAEARRSGVVPAEAIPYDHFLADL